MGTKGKAAGWRERFIGLREDLLLDNSRGNRDLPTEAGVLLGSVTQGRRRHCAAEPARQRAKAEGCGERELGLGLEGFLSFFFSVLFYFFF